MSGAPPAATSSILRRVFDCAGLDVSRELLRMAAVELGPEIELHQADMREFQLDDRFAVITCLWGTIAYANDATQLDDVAARMAAHLEPGGIVLIEPWLTPEVFDDDGMVTVAVADERQPVLTLVDATARNGQVAELRRLYIAATPGRIETVEEHHEPLHPRRVRKNVRNSRLHRLMARPRTDRPRSSRRRALTPGTATRRATPPP